MNKQNKLPLDLFYSNNNLSKRAYDLCMINNIGYDEDLITYYNSNKSFIELKYCDQELNGELIKFCNKYHDIDIKEIESIQSEIINKIFPSTLFDKIEEQSGIQSISIYSLLKTKDLNVRTLNVCGRNDLMNTTDILNYFKKHQSFSSLYSCGVKSNKQLIELCKRIYTGEIYLKPSEYQKLIDSVNIRALLENGEISVRIYNICIANDLMNTIDILGYYKKHKSFSQLHNFGEKSEKGLIELCRKIESNNLDTKSTKLAIINLLNIKELNDIQIQILNSFIIKNIKNYSIRANNALRLFLNGNIDIQQIDKKILSVPGFDFDRMKNVGKKSTIEIRKFTNSVVSYYKYISEIKDDEALINLRSKYIVEELFNIENVPEEIIKTRSILKLTDYLINTNAIFDKKQTGIFKRGLKIYHNTEVESRDNLVKIIGLSKERIRQISEKLVSLIPEKLLFLSYFDDTLCNDCQIDINDNILYVSNEKSDCLNQLHNTNFSEQFITIILSGYLSHNFSIVGNVKDVVIPAMASIKSRHIWKNIFLVKSNFIQNIDLNSIINDISWRLSQRIEESYKFNFIDYISPHIINSSIEPTTIAKIAEQIINIEFNLYLDKNYNIIFERNTKMQLTEYIEEILEELDTPSNIDEIYDLFQSKYPGVTKSKKALHGSMGRSQKIIFFGRNSTFGLKKWEEERDDIKGGTIKDIVLEYLQGKDNPIHIFEIFEEVHKYRKETIPNSISGNLKLDPYKQFTFFNQNFIGLSSRAYSGNVTQLPRFLGKTIKRFSKDNLELSKEQLIDYFSKDLEISVNNTKYIIDFLEYNKFIEFS